LTEQQEQQSGEVKITRRSRNGFWFGIVIVITILGLAGAGFYFFTLLRDKQEGLGGEVKGQLSKQMADYQSQLSAIQNQLAALEANIGSKDAHFSKTLSDFSALHSEKITQTKNELGADIEQLQRQLGKTRGDWLLADAEYLLSVASERLHLVGDVNTTREALEAADQRLRESGDSGVINVRQQIAKDLVAIRNVQIPDIVGLFALVQTLESQVDQLQTALPYAGKESSLKPDKNQSEKPENSGDEESLVDSAITQLGGLVTIRRTEQSINEILTPEQAKFIHEQLRVKLELVKIALIQHNEEIYQTSLIDAKDWLNLHFTKTDGMTAMMAELNRLSETKIRSQYPDISLSLKMLRDIAKLRLNTETATNPAPAQPATLVPAAPTPETTEQSGQQE